MRKLLAKFSRFWKSIYLPAGTVSSMTIAFGPEIDDRMEYLVEKTGSEDKAELTSRALALYSYLWERKLAGASINLIEDGKTESLVLR